MRKTTNVRVSPDDDDCTVVHLPDEVTDADVPAVRERLLWLLNRRVSALVLDLSATRFCDPGVFTALVRARIRAMAMRTPIGVVLPPGGPVCEEFARSEVHRLLPHATTLDDVRAALRAPAHTPAGAEGGDRAGATASAALRATASRRYDTTDPAVDHQLQRIDRGLHLLGDDLDLIPAAQLALDHNLSDLDHALAHGARHTTRTGPRTDETRPTHIPDQRS